MAVLELIEETPAPVQEQLPDQDGDVFHDAPEYPPEELERLVAEASNHKQAGNQHFAVGRYKEAIQEYEAALEVSPESFTKDRAIYYGNMAACYLKMQKYADARTTATKALELDPGYTKALLRRAQANEKLGTYSSLSDALEDYKKLKTQPDIDAHSRRECDRAIRQLPPVIKAQMEKEKEEMMGKLKDLGNTLLGKFGLSTDNFQLQKDPNSGGYSVNFVNNSNAKK